jgi:1,4-alpha-glucan branching enzyme
MLERWRRDNMTVPVTVSLSPPLCAMLRDPLLCGRYERHLNGLIELAEKEIRRTHWDRAFRELAWMYHHRFSGVREFWQNCGGNLVHAFKQLQDEGRIEIITTAATHALLPMLASHPQSIRAQILTARDDYRSCFGRDPRGIWLPECAYVAGVETYLQEANIRWFILDTHGILHADPRPRYGTFAPVFTPNGIAAFGRDFDSSRQVWSQREGYPGDPVTAIFTATSVSTWTSTTSNPTCPRPKRAASPASNITASPARARNRSTSATPPSRPPTNTPSIS